MICKLIVIEFSKDKNIKSNTVYLIFMVFNKLLTKP